MTISTFGFTVIIRPTVYSSGSMLSESVYIQHHALTSGFIHINSYKMKPVLCAFVMALIALQRAECLKRTYYIGIREEYWDYAPSRRNLINNRSIDQE